MDRAEEQDITTLLDAIRAGEDAAKDKLIETVYDECQRIASRYAPGVRADRTQATALVNEPAIRLLKLGTLDHVGNRKHSYHPAAKAIGQLLADECRRQQTQRRGGDLVRRSLSKQQEARAERHVDDEVWLDEALLKLEALSPRMVTIVELKPYAGLTNKEIAAQLDIGVRTVEKESSATRAWLFRELHESNCG